MWGWCQDPSLSPPVKYFTDRSKAVLLLWTFYVFPVLCLLCLCVCLFICALWSPAEKGLASGLSFVVSYCEFVSFPLVSWVRCGTWLYRFLIFASLLTFIVSNEKMLKIHPAIYPYLRSEIKTTLIPSGQYSFSADDIFQSLVPCQLIMGLVASVSYMGDYWRNPFYFHNSDCCSVGFYVDGQSYPSKPLRPNFKTNQYVEYYRTLTCFPKDIIVKRNDYVKGYCLYMLGDGFLFLSQYQKTRPLPSVTEVCQTPARECHHDHVCYLPRNCQHRSFKIGVPMMNPMTLL